MTGARRGIACAGNWIVDIVHVIDGWPAKGDLVHIRQETTGVGGGAANVALALAAFDAGLPVRPVGLVGEDGHGETVRAACDAAGLGTEHLEVRPGATTAHTHVMTVPGDSRTFFYHPGANDLLDEADVPVEALAGEGLALFYLGYLNLMGRLDALEGGTNGAARVLARAKAAGMTTCVDLVSADTAAFRAVVEAALPAIDYLFLNEVEAGRATGLAVAGPEDRAGIEAAAAALKAGGAGAVIVHSPALSLWHDGAARWAEAEAVDPAEVLSPVGAGDAFCAGALLGIHEGWPVERCLALAHRAAAASLRGATATGSIPKLAALMPGAG